MRRATRRRRRVTRRRHCATRYRYRRHTWVGYGYERWDSDTSPSRTCVGEAAIILRRQARRAARSAHWYLLVMRAGWHELYDLITI